MHSNQGSNPEHPQSLGDLRESHPFGRDALTI